MQQLDFITHKQQNINIAGTSYRGRVDCPYDQIVRSFGKPYEGDGDKTRAEWAIEFDDGTVATIYDYKTNIDPIKNHDWHIGGFKPIAVEHILHVLATDAMPLTFEGDAE